MNSLTREQTEVQSYQTERPLLIFKIGVLGCAPLNFCETLADEYDANVVSSDKIRKEIMDARDAEGMDPLKAQDINSREIKRLVGARTLDLLSENEDVVLDMFCNTEGSRKFPLDLAKRTGATTIALWINTPFQKAIERVTEWTRQDAFIVPVSRWDIPPVQAAKTMMNHVEWPNHEGIDWVYKLDGSSDTDYLLDQFDDYLQGTGLIDRYTVEDDE